MVEPNVDPIAPGEEFQFNNSGFNAAHQRFTPSTRTFNHSEVRVAVEPVTVEGLPKLAQSKLPADLPNTSPITTAVNRTPQTTSTGNDTARINPNQAALIARLQEKPQPQKSQQLGNQTLPKLQPESMAKAPELPLNRVNQQQGLIARLNSYENLRQTIQQQYPNSKQKTVIRETITANQGNVEGTVSGFLVVDTEGKILDIKFQDKSVSTELQLKTREYFSTRSPRGDEQISSYPFSLRFQNKHNTAEATQGQTPAANVKPLPQLRIPNEQSAPISAVTSQPTNNSQPNGNSLESTLESTEKLKQQLRQWHEAKKESSAEK
jgi:hypothetical protein